jgi:hypothetical protein
MAPTNQRIKDIFYLLSGVGTVVGGLALARNYLSPNDVIYDGEEKLYGKTVIITGANRGIGKVTAHELAKRGELIIKKYQIDEFEFQLFN